MHSFPAKPSKIFGGLVFMIVPVSLLAGCGSSPSASPTPTPRPSVRPTPTPVGTGNITFGSALNSNGTAVINHGKTIAANEPLAWVASFSSAPASGTITLTITQVSGPGHHPVQRWLAKVHVSPSATSASGALTTAQLNASNFTKNAAFQMVYHAGGKTLASGKFKRLSCSNCSGSSGSQGY